MARTKLLVEVLDDGHTVTITVRREETVGNVEIGPIPVREARTLAFPWDDVDQWQRDMVVQVLELL